MTVPDLDKVEVDIFAEHDGKGGVLWSHKVKNPGHGHGQKIKLPRGIGYEIHFDLRKPHDLNVQFDASAPFFCKEGTADPCPSEITTDQIMVESCEKDELVVVDWNYGKEQELRYQLNFVDDAGARVDPYDPVILNEGGGTKPNMS
jgi:hypothetical protein